MADDGAISCEKLVCRPSFGLTAECVLDWCLQAMASQREALVARQKSREDAAVPRRMKERLEKIKERKGMLTDKEAVKVRPRSM